jgi:transforming growth factor-beta-induced protein
MENNCFVDSDVPVTSTASTVTVVSGATVSSVNNFVSPSQADVLACPFVSEFDPDYNFVQCGAAVADATACGSDSPVAAPTIDAVLPSTLATLQSSGLDVEFILRWATNTGYAEFLARSTVQIGYPLTTFIPLDSAFQDNVDFWNDIIDNPIWFYHSDCAISYHLHLGTLTTPQWQYISTASTLLLETIALGTDPATGAFLANGQPLVDGGTDIATETGIIHYLDSPLIPRCLSDTIADFLINSSAFTILVELAGIAGLLEALEETRPLTLFAPTNDAFAKLDAATLEFLRNNPEELSEILLYHVYIGNLNISPEFNGVEVPTASNATFTLQVDPGTGAAFVNGESSVIAPNNLAFNGFLHAVDTVLMPPTVTPTTIAPVTGAPTTAAPVETTIAPVTSAPVGVTTVAPMTAAPIMPTSAPVTAAPIMPTSAPVTAAPTTASPVVPTNAPVTAAPVTAPPTSGAMTAAGSGMLGLVVASVMFVFM